jgi:hypothetical protein
MEGYYEKNHKDYSELADLVESANRSNSGTHLIYCLGRNRFQNGVSQGKGVSWKIIQEHLAQEKQKGVLIIWFTDNRPKLKPFVLEPSKPFYPSKIKRIGNLAREIKSRVYSLGYQRVLMLTHSTSREGFYILLDEKM